MSLTTVTDDASHRQRLRLMIRGAVQGVGFRPFVYRLATELRLDGWVINSSQGVCIEVEGAPERLQQFLLRVGRENPPRSFIQSLESSCLDAVGYDGFEIRQSDDSGAKTTIVLPDTATCGDCVDEIFDPANRRCLYPFTNCTNCGPRFSIIESLPYDRPRTTMKLFAMCARCRAEYEDPLDRRFHAQPNACPDCGPHLEFRDAGGAPLATHHEALLQTAAAIRDGALVAVQGLGGFHLMADARCGEAVARLRARKHREEKPFALMFPHLTAARAVCRVSALEERLLLSPEAPILLLEKLPHPDGAEFAPHLEVAPDNPCLGIMLPYTPLHHLLLRALGFPVIATSGNQTDEPICTDGAEAVTRLRGIADFYLTHNRPIHRHVDDSIVRVMAGREMVLRRARGYAPLPVPLTDSAPPLLAVGAHLKNTVAAAADKQVFLSQHLGDLETEPAYRAFRHVIRSLQELYELQPVAVACDLHPDYASTHFAAQTGLPVVAVQHHFAHVLSCMAENEISGPVLGVAWDGTGYGTDGTIWGGEFLVATPESYTRTARLRPFPLPGGDRAVHEPRRTALGLLYAAYESDAFARSDLATLQAFTAAELRVIRTMLERRLQSPLTSSVGRLFDAVASLAGLRQQVRFEGQAAMQLELAVGEVRTGAAYGYRLVPPAGDSPPLLDVDWTPLLTELLADVSSGVPLAEIAAKFHNTLIAVIVEVAQRTGEERVVLTGGCFQNRYLTKHAVRALRQAGFRPYWHQRVPPNDGGIALGQIVAAAHTVAVPPISPASDSTAKK